MTSEAIVDRQEDTETDLRLLYWKEVGKYPLLTREREIELGKLIKDGRSAEEKLSKGGLKEKATFLTEQSLWGKRAREEMVKCNLRLVVSVAKRYLYSKIPFLDLVQEGNLGFIRAAQTFDYEKGRFSAYAVPWIRQKIRRFINFQGQDIPLPVYQSEKIRRIKMIEEKMRESLGRKPTDEELAGKLKMSLKKLVVLTNYAAATVTVSLNNPCSDEIENGPELGDYVSDNGAVNPEEPVINKDRKEAVNKVLLKLTSREQKIIRMRLGIGYLRGYSFEEIGNEADLKGGNHSNKSGKPLTRERVRQIYEEALEKIRTPCLARGLQDFVS